MVNVGDKTEPVDGPGLPPCKPPPTRKQDVFNKDGYKDVDNHIRQLPEDLMHKPLPEVFEQITKNGGWKDDVAIVRAIFYWIVTRNNPDNEASNLEPTSKCPAMYFVKNALHHGMAALMHDLCRLAGIPCVTITGLRHFQPSSFDESGLRTDYWNAVFVAGGWRLVSPTIVTRYNIGQGQGQQEESSRAQTDRNESDKWIQLEGFSMNHKPGELKLGIDVVESHFLADPCHFIRRFYPSENRWQLLDPTVSEENFKDGVFVTEQFFDLEMSFLPESWSRCYLEYKGEKRIQFGLPKTKKGDYTFKYRLFIFSTTNIPPKSALEKYVVYGQKSDRLTYSLRLPVAGQYKFEVYGGISHGRPCFTYFINCIEPSRHQHIPVVPNIGWGPNPVSDKIGIIPVNYDEPEVDCPAGQVSITLDMEKAYELQKLLKHNEISDVNLSNCSVLETKDRKATAHMRLPAKGEYALQLFVQSLGDAEAQNVLNYLLQTRSSARPFPNLTNGILGSNRAANDMFKVKVSVHPTTNWIEVDGDKVNLQFTTETEVRLFFELHSNDPNAETQSSLQATESNSKLWDLTLNLPVRAEYSLNVFVRLNEDTPALYGVYSFLITTMEKGRQSVPKMKVGESVPRVNTRTIQTTANKLRFPLETHHDSIGITVEPVLGRPNTNLTSMRFDNPSLVVDIEEEGEYIVNMYTITSAKHTELLGETKCCVILTQNKHFVEQQRLALMVTKEHLAEFRSYNSPPDGIFPVLKAAFLLLGYDREDLRSWPSVQYLLHDDNQEEILQDLAGFNPYQANRLTSKEVVQILNKFHWSRASLTSAGANILYSWVKEVLDALRGIYEAWGKENLKFQTRPPTAWPKTAGRNSLIGHRLPFN